MTTLLVWRHGRTAWNATDRVQGQSDIELDATGHAQAEAAAPWLAARRPDAIVASDLRRCVDTAAPLAARTGLVATYDPRLRERDHGPWHGLHRAEIAARWPEAFLRWARGEPTDVPGVESNDDLAKRVCAALRDAADRAPGGTVVVATHGAAARFGIGALLDWPDAAVRTLAVLGNCHWAELRYDGRRGWRLSAYNVGAPTGPAVAPGSAVASGPAAVGPALGHNPGAGAGIAGSVGGTGRGTVASD
jgi:glucosyl-3-phosphoglycerate phosphatase